MLGMKNHFNISGSIEIREVDIAGMACTSLSKGRVRYKKKSSYQNLFSISIFSFGKLSVSFHRFEVNYWMSFARQHGLQLTGSSFSLELKSDLALVPVKDGLVHRPNAVWSVDYLSCELSDSKIWLCSSQLKHDEEVLGANLFSYFASLLILTEKEIWAASWQNQQNDLYTHSDQSLHCLHEETLSLNYLLSTQCRLIRLGE